jgi:hypothetical protein
MRGHSGPERKRPRPLTLTGSGGVNGWSECPVATNASIADRLYGGVRGHDSSFVCDYVVRSCPIASSF